MGAIVGIIILIGIVWVVGSMLSQPGAADGCGAWVAFMVVAVAVIGGGAWAWSWYTSQSTTEAVQLSEVSLASGTEPESVEQISSARTVRISAIVENNSDELDIVALRLRAIGESCPIDEAGNVGQGCTPLPEPEEFYEGNFQAMSGKTDYREAATLERGSRARVEHDYLVTGVPEGRAIRGRLELVRACTKSERSWCED